MQPAFKTAPECLDAMHVKQGHCAEATKKQRHTAAVVTASICTISVFVALVFSSSFLFTGEFCSDSSELIYL